MKMKSCSSSPWYLSLVIASLLTGLAVLPVASSSPQDTPPKVETGDKGMAAQSGDDINVQAEGAAEAQEEEPVATQAESDDEATVSDSDR